MSLCVKSLKNNYSSSKNMLIRIRHVLTANYICVEGVSRNGKYEDAAQVIGVKMSLRGDCNCIW